MPCMSGRLLWSSHAYWDGNHCYGHCTFLLWSLYIWEVVVMSILQISSWHCWHEGQRGSRDPRELNNCPRRVRRNHIVELPVSRVESCLGIKQPSSRECKKITKELPGSTQCLYYCQWHLARSRMCSTYRVPLRNGPKVFQNRCRL